MWQHLWQKSAFIWLIVLALPLLGQRNHTNLLFASESGQTWWGIDWGYARSYWSMNKNDEGKPAAGTAAPLIGIRRVQPLAGIDFIPFAQLSWSHSTTSYLVCDTCYGELYSLRNTHREFDLGLHARWFPNVGCGSVYFGGGPSVRLGHYSQTELDNSSTYLQASRTGELLENKNWIGLTILAGWQTWYGDRFAAYFEPQLTYSPAARTEGDYNPPTNLSMKMGFYWK